MSDIRITDSLWFFDDPRGAILHFHATEQEVMDALDNPLEVRTLSAIKYRCRATMGRCQGGFCRARIVKIMEDQFGAEVKDMTLRGKGSHLFVGRTKDLRKHDTKEC